MSGPAPPSRLLRAALRAYPRRRRERDGAILLDCADELRAAGSPLIVEAAGLVRGGLAARASGFRSDLRAAPLGEALAILAVPLAIASLAFWIAGAMRLWPIGLWWSLVLGGAVLALLGAVTRRRPLAVGGWILVLALVAQELLAGEIDVSSGSRLDVDVGTYSLDAIAATAPIMLLGLTSALRIGRPARPAHRRAVALTAVAAVLAAAAPEAVWILAGTLPYPGSAAALCLLAGLGCLCAIGVLALAARAGRRA
jgi:hypothetical protein